MTIVQGDAVSVVEKPAMFRPAVVGHRIERNRAPWTADEIDRLCELMSIGKPIREIARLFGRTQEAVRTKAYQLDRLRGPSL